MAGTVQRKIKGNRILLATKIPLPVKIESLEELEIFNSSFKEINRLLLKYASGNFNYRGKISGMLNSVDTVISGINMLGEELQSSTISRDYFTGIFNAVPDMIFVISPRGVIRSINQSTANFFGIRTPDASGLKLSEVFELQEKKSFFGFMKSALVHTSSFACEAKLTNIKGNHTPVWCLGNRITDTRDRFAGYLLVARDITDKKQSENKILRAIVETQENEQRRVAEDLHDSLGQELSALKLYLISLQNKLGKSNPGANQTLQQSLILLDNSIQNLRGICFNLLPGTIQLSGLPDAIDMLVKSLNEQTAVQIKFQNPRKYIPVKKTLEVALYRIAQEFISNSIKHSAADRITIRLSYTQGIGLYLSDNGKGFNPGAKFDSGNGLRNMRSRVNAFNGTFNLASSAINGTNLFIQIPYPDDNSN